MFLCPRCGGQDFIELEEHQVGYSEESEKKATSTKPIKCLACNFEFVPPSLAY